MEQSKEFKKLQKEWYKRLKDVGFEDIEDENHILKEKSISHITKKVNGEYYEQRAPSYEIRAEYYRLAGYFLNDWHFQSATEKLIWQLHAEGLSYRHIAKLLKTSGVKPKANKDNIQGIIKKLKNDMLLTYRGGLRE